MESMDQGSWQGGLGRIEGLERIVGKRWDLRAA